MKHFVSLVVSLALYSLITRRDVLLFTCFWLHNLYKNYLGAVHHKKFTQWSQTTAPKVCNLSYCVTCLKILFILFLNYLLSNTSLIIQLFLFIATFFFNCLQIFRISFNFAWFKPKI